MKGHLLESWREKKMRPNVIMRIEKKELTLFFSSPIGYLFLGAFLAVTLFIFFWVESFFARNIADVRPMFEWLPVLLIFLCAALTMRMWSEERRTGTLEFVVTVPVATWEFVLGKFFACWTLLGIALVLTLPLPLTVAFIGDLDWGPVFAGYLAALLLGGAYIAIGLYVSAKTDSQIVSLIISSLVCLLFYLVGSPNITELFGATTQGLLTSIGSGSRFEAITRGVIDIRDMYFYLSVLAMFLALNVYALEREKWAADGDKTTHQNWRVGTGLLIANMLLANVWLNNVNLLRVDMTEDEIYSISDSTKGYLSQLREPLLIRGYFSSKTHPLLAPLVPRMKDLLREYEVAGGGRVRVEVVDPADQPELESEANTKYGIRAVPFQIADRYQASLVNSYFDVLILYGDEYEVLSFRDLIEVKVQGETDIDVQLKNPEFDVTRSIKKVLYGFQGGSSIFANVNDPVRFVGYLSGDEALPEPLVEFKGEMGGVLDDLVAESGDKFTYEIVDPDAGDGSVAEDIVNRFGFQPMATSLFSDERFYFYMTLQDDETVVSIPVPEGLSGETLKKGIEEGLKRYATGLLKSVILTAPEPVPPYMQQQGVPPGNQFTQLQGMLTSDFDVATNDLGQGVVPADADLLIVADPSNLSEKQVFAIDQFLMRGGTVVISSGAYASQLTQTALTAMPRPSGLEAWLAHNGVTIGQSLVMDPQNSAFPAPVPRNVGGFSFTDIVMLDYPYFVDVRGPGLTEDLPITAGLPSVAMSWASPIELAPGEGVAATPLMASSPGSWLSTSTDVMPRLTEDGLSAFTPEGEQASHTLGVLLEGKFTSFFAGQDSPLLDDESAAEGEDAASEAGEEEETSEAAEPELGVVTSVIDRSPESARLIVFSSNDFLADQMLQIIGSADGTLYGNSVQLMVNVVDWALEDQSLTGIRARGNFNRTLPTMEVGEQSVLEYFNYGLALLGIFAVLLVFRSRNGKSRALYSSWLGLQGDAR
jgi:ABC-2 type transport system permease protein